MLYLAPRPKLQIRPAGGDTVSSACGGVVQHDIGFGFPPKQPWFAVNVKLVLNGQDADEAEIEAAILVGARNGERVAGVGIPTGRRFSRKLAEAFLPRLKADVFVEHEADAETKRGVVVVFQPVAVADRRLTENAGNKQLPRLREQHGRRCQ